MKYKKFQELLDDQVQWPEYYTFKFIIKEEQINEMFDKIDIAFKNFDEMAFNLK